MDDMTLAQLLLGRSRSLLSPNSRDAHGTLDNNSTTITCEAIADSAAGYVTVLVSGIPTDIPTTFAVRAGDEVIVNVANNSPVAVGVVGKGDDVDRVISGTIKAASAIIGTVIAGSVSAESIEAVNGYIESLEAGDFSAESIESTTANVVRLIAKDAEFDSLSATKAVIGTLEAAKAFIGELTAGNVTAEKLKSASAYIEKLEAGNITAEKLSAASAYIGELTAGSVTAEQIAAGLATVGALDATYANIDFANVDVANIGEFFAKSGVIQDIVTESGTVTGRLVGITIVGDLIEAGTLKADRLVVLGEDGLYYKLNVGAETVESRQTDYNSINGSNIQAQSIAATKVSVSDLVAFGATIGGIVIEDGCLRSFAKDSVDSGTAGFYLGSDGSARFGGASSYVRYDAVADEVEIKAKSLSIGVSSVATQTDAMGYASTAKSEAVSAAASDATTKANSAKSSAVSTAAADATAKANSALASAKSYADAQIKVQADRITSNVAATDALGARVSTVEQTASGLSVSLESVEATANSANATANTARTEAANAAKTASNYMQYTVDGLEVGNRSSGAWSGFRSRMAADAFQVLDAAGNVLSSFGSDLIELGKSSASAGINLCANNGRIVGFGTPQLSGLAIVSDSLSLCKKAPSESGYASTPKIVIDSGSVAFPNGASFASLCTNQSSAYPVYGGRVLYENASGSAGTVALAESAANFKHMRIYFVDNNGNGYASLDVWKPNGKQPMLTTIEGNSSSMTFIRRTKYTISGTTLAPSGVNGERGYLCFSTGSIINNDMTTNYVRVIAVVGYK